MTSIQPLLVSQEIKLVKILAGNNARMRNRTVKRLIDWLNERAARSLVDENSFMRLWKGLFYAMWMSDKPLIQEQCAEELAKLVHLKQVKYSLLFFKCFLQTMVNEWFGIDQHRMDKFLMLVRRMLRHMLEELQKYNWDKNHINTFRENLNQTILKVSKNFALGLILHITEIYLEELAKVSLGKISSKMVLEMIQPFCQEICRIDDYRLVTHIHTYIFKYLIDQSDIGIEYKEKFKVWKEMRFPGNSIDTIQLVETEVEQDEDLEEMLKNQPKDPRAGKVDVVLPQLQFDPLAVVNLLQSLKTKQYCTVFGRKSCTKLIEDFKMFANGEYPFGIKEIPDVRDSSIKIKSALKRLENLENSEDINPKKRKAKSAMKKNVQSILLEQLNNQDNNGNSTAEENQSKEDIDDNHHHKVKKRKLSDYEIGAFEEFIKKSEGHLMNTNLIKINEKQQTINNKKLTKTKIIKNKNGKNLDAKQIDPFGEFVKKSEGHLMKTNLINVNEKQQTVNSNKLTKTKIVKNKNYKNEENLNAKLIEFKRNSGVWKVEVFDSDSNDSKKSSIKPSKKGVKRLKQEKKTVSIVAKKSSKKIKNAVKNPFSLKNEMNKKKIKFSTKVYSQEYKDYQKQVINSPIPYDASKKPRTSLLKQTPFSSPINPFAKLD